MYKYDSYKLPAAAICGSKSVSPSVTVIMSEIIKREDYLGTMFNTKTLTQINNITHTGPIYNKLKLVY